MEIKRCINCMEQMTGPVCSHCGYREEETEQATYGLKPNSILRGRYLVGNVLGQGGFGITYIGFDIALDVKVAIKEYFPMGYVSRDSTHSNQITWNTSHEGREQWEKGCESFLKEARRMALIDSLPEIVRVRDTFMENQTAYIVMDYVEGETLKAKLLREGTMKMSDCVLLLMPLMESLAKVHARGLIHRDISPDNIMVLKEGDVRLLDLGAAKDLTIGTGGNSQLVTKKGFSPAEQYMESGRTGSWTDVYALCATIYYCITGKTVPEAMDRLMGDTLTFEFPLKEELMEKTEKVLREGLAVKAEERIQTVEELCRRLKEAVCADAAAADNGKTAEKAVRDEAAETEKKAGKRRVSAKKPEEEGAPVRRKKRKRWIAAAVLVALLFLFFGSDSDTPKDESTAGKADAPGSDGAAADASEQRESAAENDTPGQDNGAAASASEISALRYMLMDTFPKEGVFGNEEHKRSSVVRAVFSDTISDLPENAWDVSQKQDGSVMAWLTPENSGGTCLHIGAEGRIGASSCAEMFFGYENLQKIEFNHCFDTGHVTDMYGMFRDCVSLKELDLSDFDTSQTTNMSFMFAACRDLSELDLSSFDTGSAQDMSAMFYGCSGLEELDLSGFDTGRVKNMNFMFGNSTRLTKLDLSSFDTSQVTDMGAMFHQCSSLETVDLSSFETGKVTTMGSMFRECGKLKQLDVSGFDTGQVADMGVMFMKCTGLKQLDVSGFDTGQATSMYCMFYGCSGLAELDVSSFDTAKVTNMENLFADCTGLKKLDVSSFDTGQVTNMSGMFYGCSGLAELDVSGFDTGRTENMKLMFGNVSGLTELDVSSFDTGRVTDMTNMFYGCSSLEKLNVKSFQTRQVLSMGGMFSGCSSLTELDLSGFDVRNADRSNMFEGAGISGEEAGL